MGSPELIVDPEISRAKFDREVAQFRQLEDEYLRHGWFLLQADFPDVFVVFATPATSPPALVFGAIINFENYDFWPPSVRLVNPFTRQPYLAKETPVQMLRAVSGPPLVGGLAELPAGTVPPNVQVQPVLVAHSKDEKPFLCLPGVREYHDHPAHSADSWLLHRGRGEGTLHFILDNLHKYGVQPIGGFHLTYRIQFLNHNIPQ